MDLCLYFVYHLAFLTFLSGLYYLIEVLVPFNSKMRFRSHVPRQCLNLKVGVAMLRGAGDSLTWKSWFLGVWFLGFLVSWFLEFLVSWFLVSWFLGVLVSKFLGFWVSEFLGFLVPRFLGFKVSWFLGFKISKLQWSHITKNAFSVRKRSTADLQKPKNKILQT